jgi:hypothetical protein
MADLMKTLPYWVANRETVPVEDVTHVEFGYEKSPDDSMAVVTVKYTVETKTEVEILAGDLPGFINDLMEVEKQRLERINNGA